MTSTRIWVCAENASGAETARRHAMDLGLDLLAPGTAADALPPGAVVLQVGEELALRQTGPHAPGPVRAEFGSPRMRHRRRAGHNELLGRAVGCTAQPAPAVLDVTAGLGRDAFVLADLGCRVWLCEREPLIALLLQNGLGRAARGDQWLAAVVARMTLLAGDPRAADAATLPAVDVIYLDPMFARANARARPKKAMALFQALLGNAAAQRDDAADLLAWALRQSVRRVVVKRPLKAPPLGAGAPGHSLRGRAVRFDVYAVGGGAPAQEASNRSSTAV